LIVLSSASTINHAKTQKSVMHLLRSARGSLALVPPSHL